MTPPLEPATLYIGPSQEPLERERVVAALRDRRIPALVGAGDDEPPLVRVAVDARGDVVVLDRDGGLAGIDAQELVVQLAAAWGTELILDGATAFATAGSTDATAVDDPPVDPASRVYVMLGEVPRQERLSELALQLEASITVIPAARGAVIVPHGPLTAYWPPAQRPVVALELSPREVRATVWTRAGIDAERGRARLAMRAIADLDAVWMPHPAAVLADEPAAKSVLELLAGPIGAEPGEAARTELGAQITAALAEPWGEDLPERLAVALGMPPGAAAVLRGAQDPDGLAGARRIERSRMGQVIADQVLVPPSGTSLWARWQGIPHRHPRLAVALTAAEVVVTVALILVGVIAPPQQPWLAVLWVVASVLAIDVISDLVLLRALRRRRRST